MLVLIFFGLHHRGDSLSRFYPYVLHRVPHGLQRQSILLLAWGRAFGLGLVQDNQFGVEGSLHAWAEAGGDEGKSTAYVMRTQSLFFGPIVPPDKVPEKGAKEKRPSPS